MTAVTAHSANEGSFGNATDFTDVGMIMNDSGVYDENNNNNFDLAVRANLSGVDKLRFLTDFYRKQWRRMTSSTLVSDPQQ